ncbi:MAG: class II aldolase/adducin family protein [Candidatus Omnitrophica bacterium]|nr:class II aldolase/adducin family protein [Candidatus Omnitrophota bacterium]
MRILEDNIEELAALCQYAGARTDFVQAAGGNVSVKADDKSLLIKASGCLLNEVNLQEGWVLVNKERVYEALLRSVSAVDEKLQDNQRATKELRAASAKNGKWPSIETYFHVLFQKYTLHTHPVAVNLMLCQKNSREEILNLFPDSLFIDYATPGIEVAREILKHERCREGNPRRKASVVFLKNHGVIVSADDMNQVARIHDRVVESLEKIFGVRGRTSMGPKGQCQKTHDHWCESRHPYLLKQLKAKEELFFHPPLTPDEFIFCGYNAVRVRALEKDEGFVLYESRWGSLPKVVIRNHGIYFNTDSVQKANQMEEVLWSHIFLLDHLKKQPEYLSAEECMFLSQWEAEKYRQSR